MISKKQKPKIFITRYTELLDLSLRERLKLFFNIQRGNPLDYPRQFWIEITNKCNLQCIMCPLSVGLKRKKTTMMLGDFAKIIDQICIRQPRIMLHVGGEPMLNRNLFSMIEYAKNKGCWVGIHTNATLLTQEMSMGILQSALDYISFSFDGCTPEIYEKIRVGARFDKVRLQIEEFLRLHLEKKVKIPHVRIELLLMNSTKQYVDDFIAYWKAKNVDTIAIRPAGDWSGLVKFLGLERIKTFGCRPCRDVFTKCAILADGTVVPCCKDIEGRVPLGNILKEPFDKIWNGDNYKALRKQHLKNAMPQNSICQTCCYRHSWSRMENYMQGIIKQIFYVKAKC